MKLIRYVLLLILSLLSWQLNAQLLWKISENNLSKPSYIFGTHHLIDKDQIKGFDEALRIVDSTDAVVGEMDLTDMASIQQKMIQGSMMNGKTCKDLYSSEDYTFLDGEFKALLGTGLDQLGVMKPMALNTVYALFSYMKAAGMTKQPEALDMLFQNEAIQHEKKVIGLETPEFQLDILFNSSSLERQAELLLKQVREKDKAMSQVKEFQDAYLRGDFTAMEAFQKQDSTMTTEEQSLLIDKRNNNWMKTLPGLMKEQSCFIAVGFLHLIGQNGLVNQLQQSGYKVEPITL